MPSRRFRPASNCSASASCGTHFGETKLVASRMVRPVAANRSRNSSFTSTGSTDDSFCSPSRAPTSQIVTSAGRSPAGTTVGSPSSRAPMSAAVLVVAELLVVVVDLPVQQRVHVLDLRDVVELQRLVGRGLDD